MSRTPPSTAFPGHLRTSSLHVPGYHGTSDSDIHPNDYTTEYFGNGADDKEIADRDISGTEAAKNKDLTSDKEAASARHGRRSCKRPFEDLPLLRRPEHRNNTVITCTRCHHHGLNCDNKIYCWECYSSGRFCKRYKCQAFEAGRCTNAQCDRFHADDEGLHRDHIRIEAKRNELKKKRIRGSKLKDYAGLVGRRYI